MNICILKESLDIGGTEKSAANISKAIKNDHNIIFALYDSSKIKYEYVGELADFKLPPKSGIIGKAVNTYLRNFKLKRLIKKKNIDILYTFTGVANRQTRYKYNTVKIISARDFGGMRDRYSEYDLALKNSDAMICNSEYTKNFYVSKYPENAHKVYALYNYIDSAEIRIQAREEVETEYTDFINTHEKTLVSVGRFCKEKGFEYLIKAFAKARENDNGLGLVLVGDGEYRSKYEEIIEKHGIKEHIYFTGFQKNPYKYMEKCTAFVLSSLSEGFPNVLAEAMALSLPVIASNCYSGPAEILMKDADYSIVTNEFKECDYGIITPQFTEEDITNAVNELVRAMSTLLSDQERLNRYALASAQRAEDFSSEAARQKLNAIFDELIKRRQAK